MSLARHLSASAPTTAGVKANRVRAVSHAVSRSQSHDSRQATTGEYLPTAALKCSLGLAASAVMLLNVFAAPVSAQEVATIAADSVADDAAELGRTLLPNPGGVLNKENAAKDAEAQEKRAVDAPQTSFKAASPVGGEGEISNLADQGLKGGAGFKAAAAKLDSVNPQQQYDDAKEVDKKLQKADDFEKAAQFRADAPGSKLGNSVVGRGDDQKIAGGGDKPGALSIFNLSGK